MTARTRQLTRRVLGTIGVLALAVASVGSGLDRASGGSPALSALVPGPLRAQADRTTAQLALAMMEPRTAVAAAQSAVAADPVDPGSTALLGAARLLGNDFAGSEQAFRVAARFGWRELLTQRYWYTAAVQAGDYERAAERLDALLRTRPELPGAEDLLMPLETDPAAQGALVRRLAERPLWLRTYLNPFGARTDIIARRSTMLELLARQGTQLGCDAVRGFVGKALASGSRATAQRVWLGHCPGATLSGLLIDGGLAQLASGDPSPFGWTVERSGDVTVRTEQTGEDKFRLVLRNRAGVSRLVLRQAIDLPPGRYRLRATGAANTFAASLGCERGPGVPRLVVGDLAAGGQELRVLEPCSRLELGIWLRPTPQDVALAGLALERID